MAASPSHMGMAAIQFPSNDIRTHPPTPLDPDYAQGKENVIPSEARNPLSPLQQLR